VDLGTVETNIVVIDVAATGQSVDECVVRLEKQGILVVGFGRTRMRAVAHLDIDDADVDRAIAAFETVFAKV
jgi:threonine aldolase